MDPEIKNLLLRTLALSEENNEMLKKLRGSQKRAEIMKILYWVLILGVTIVSYVLVAPYIKSLTETYSGINGDIQEFQNLLDNY